jgi:hypothetical protein
MAAYSKDRNQQGESYQLARLLLEYGLVPDDLKRDRKLLREIHGWTRAIWPVEEKKPENCELTLPELIGKNTDEFKLAEGLTVYSDGEIQMMSQEEKIYYRNILDGISDNIKEIVRRGKLIENQGQREGAPLP